MDNSNKILNPTTNRYVKKTSALCKLIFVHKNSTSHEQAKMVTQDSLFSQ